MDLGINNLTSVQRAFTLSLETSDSVVVIEANPDMTRPDLIVLPGLGKFATGMSEIRERNLLSPIKEWTNEGSKLVGICLGMQLLGTSSEESLGVEGLNLIPSRIARLPGDQGERIPHTGWAETNTVCVSQPFSALATSGDFYFVHSFHLIPNNATDALSTTPFGKSSFVSSVLSRNILGLQFHPEKSGNKGKRLISEVIEWARNED
jgi:glutamine amidotransferase